MKRWLARFLLLPEIAWVFALAWVMALALWRVGVASPAWLFGAVYWLVFGGAAVLSGLLAARVFWPQKRGDAPQRAVVLSIAYVALWQFLLFACSPTGFDLDSLATLVARLGTAGLFLIGLCWTVWTVERASRACERRRSAERALFADERETEAGGAVPATATARLARRDDLDTLPERLVWNPLDAAAWYYGLALSQWISPRFWWRFLRDAEFRHSLGRDRSHRRLNQSVASLLGYSLCFTLAFLLMTQVGGCHEIYEMPAGGGQQQIAQQVKVQKVIRKKFVINPFSAIRIKVPPIDEIVVITEDLTKHAYTVGYGEGTGAGFAGGEKTGKVRFIRLEYTGGDWNQDFGVGADLNMLIEYGIRTRHKVAEQTESRTIGQLASFPAEKSPPMVFLTGQKNISLSKSEMKTLREYLLDKHGMLFIDNGGSRHFHNQVLAMMNQVLEKVRPVPVPLDDIIHRQPYRIPFLPYVAPHGGQEALGWKVDGRWVCYYHPGDIADAWSDDHAGVKPEVWQACYQLGTNVIFYAHMEYSKWLQARKADE